MPIENRDVAFGEMVYEVNARWTAAGRRSARRPGKTDRLDAQSVARVVRQEGSALPVVFPEDDSAVLDVLATERDEALGGKQGLNSAGNVGYTGPCPPHGSTHHYIFRVIALDMPTGLPVGAKASDVENAMQGHIIGTGELAGTFRR